MDISFSFQREVGLTNRIKLRVFLVQIFEKEGKKVNSLSIVFCSDDYLIKINRDFLQHNYHTDIITFDLSEPGTGKISGEIYISVDTVRSNARRFRNTISGELHRVIFHGVLHLCGYKDKTEKQQKTMRSKEDEYLDLYFTKTFRS